MPFDSKPEGRLSLADLSWRLRHPDTWPDGFVWDYSDCNRCAMGLAWQLSGGSCSPFINMRPSNAFKLTVAALADAEASFELRDIFLGLHYVRGLHVSSVTPEHVADAIDAHLATKVCV